MTEIVGEMKQGDWTVEYVRYNNSNFKGIAFAKDEEDAKRMVNGLSKLKHVTDVRYYLYADDESTVNAEASL